MNKLKQPNPPAARDLAPASPVGAARVPRPPAIPFWREARRILGLYALTAVALCWIFPPYGLWPLAFVALVPWAFATCRAQRPALVYWLSFLVGWCFFLVALRWLMPVTGLGYAALGLYLALYWPAAAWAIRTGQRHRISPLWTLPVTWVACEYLRGIVMTGFPWLFLGHALYAQLPLIQISDITGAYGVTFVAALLNGVLVEALLRRWPPPERRITGKQLRTGAIVAGAVLGATLAYGVLRLNQAPQGPEAERRGPRVAVIQPDFPLLSTPPYGEDPYVILAHCLALGAQAAREQPDLVAFPETMWSAYQNIDFIEKRALLPEVSHASWERGRTFHQAVAAFARGDYSEVNRILGELEATLGLEARRRTRPDPVLPLPRLPEGGGSAVHVLVGAVSLDQFPEAIYPKLRYYNSALLYTPDGTQLRERYNKRHLVPFGEFVPFRQARFLGFDLHWLYRRLNALSPFSYGGRFEYSLSPGSEFTVFELARPDGAGVWRFGTPICYEDTVARVVRRFVWEDGRRRLDFLVNISNDGWFLHSNELPQHLAICAFRAVENRVGIARAVNTGISGFIDANGRIYSAVERDGRRLGPGIVGYDLEHVPLDTRASVYGRVGDVFALLCVALTTVVWLGAVFERWVLAIRQRILRWWRRGEASAAT